MCLCCEKKEEEKKEGRKKTDSFSFALYLSFFVHTSLLSLLFSYNPPPPPPPRRRSSSSSSSSSSCLFFLPSVTRVNLRKNVPTTPPKAGVACSSSAALSFASSSSPVGGWMV